MKGRTDRGAWMLQIWTASSDPHWEVQWDHGREQMPHMAGFKSFPVPSSTLIERKMHFIEIY